ERLRFGGWCRGHVIGPADSSASIAVRIDIPTGCLRLWRVITWGTRWRQCLLPGGCLQPALTIHGGTYLNDLTGWQDPAAIENLSDGRDAIVSLRRQLVKDLLGVWPLRSVFFKHP